MKRQSTILAGAAAGLLMASASAFALAAAPRPGLMPPAERVRVIPLGVDADVFCVAFNGAQDNFPHMLFATGNADRFGQFAQELHHRVSPSLSP